MILLSIFGHPDDVVSVYTYRIQGTPYIHALFGALVRHCSPAIHLLYMCTLLYRFDVNMKPIGERYVVESCLFVSILSKTAYK